MMAEILSKLNPWMEARILRGRLDEELIEAARLQSVVDQQLVYLRALNQSNLKYEDALRNVVAEERPTSNATVKRMAKIAREALK